MRFSLRWRILLFTVLPPVVLTAATLWTVNGHLSRQVRSEIHANLVRSSLVFENLLSARASKLAVAAEMIALEPRFYSILLVGGASRDPGYRATVQQVAKDFREIADTDLFEVFDRRGRLLATIGRDRSTPAGRATLVKDALTGQALTGILAEGREHYHVSVWPVTAEGRVVGALLLGARIGRSLARELRTLTHSEVTFLSAGQVTGSSLEDTGEDAEVLEALAARLRQEEPAGAAGRDRPATTIGASPFELRSRKRTYLTLVRSLPHSGADTQQHYVMQRSLDDETASLREIQGGLFQLGVLAAVIALLAGVMVAERITRPVQRLVRGAEEMERGNYEYPLGAMGGDEIGYLAERFQEMRRHEQAYVSSLQEVARLKTEFIAVASHELRTPISVIKAYHDMLLGGDLGPTTPRQQQALAVVDQSIDGLVKLAEEATRMAQLESGHPLLSAAPTSIATLLESAATIASREAKGRSVDVWVDVDPGIGLVHVDGPRMTQAIANLVRNGIRFTPDGGSVQVAARREGEELVIDVADDGIGIPEHRQRDLFERPYVLRDSLHHHSSSTLEFNSAGLGLGLPIARGIVEAHGGKLLVRSRPGEGSTFTIRLPTANREDLSIAA